MRCSICHHIVLVSSLCNHASFRLYACAAVCVKESLHFLFMLILTVGKEEPRMSGFAEINGINGINGSKQSMGQGLV